MCERLYTDATILELQRVAMQEAIKADLLRFIATGLQTAAILDSSAAAYKIGYQAAMISLRQYVEDGLFPHCDNPPEVHE